MRLTIALLLVAFALGGCEFIAIDAALDEAGVGAVGEAAGSGGTAGAFSPVTLGMSEDIGVEVENGLRSGTQQGELSNAFYRLTNGGAEQGRFYLGQDGRISAAGQQLASLDAEGRVFSGARQLGFISGNPPQLFEYLRDGSTQPVAYLEGFVSENGAQIVSKEDAAFVRVLRPNVAVDVIGVADDQYLLRLADGEEVWVSAKAVSTIVLLAIPQIIVGDCPDDDHEGAVVRYSGELVPFKHCEKRDGAFVLTTDDGDTIVDAFDVKGVLTGDQIPGVQGDDAPNVMVADAQATAAAVGTAPGQPAMQILASNGYNPLLEQNRFGARSVEAFQNQRQAFAEQQRQVGPPMFGRQAPGEPFREGRQLWRPDAGRVSDQMARPFYAPQARGFGGYSHGPGVVREYHR